MRLLKMAIAPALTLGLVLGACGPDTELEDEPGLGEEPVVEEPVTRDAARAAEDVEHAFEDIDVNADSWVDTEELGTWLRDDFDGWDIGDDTELAYDDFGEQTFTLWDENDDDILSEDEWRSGVDTWYADDADVAWVDWDQDGDSELDLNEVREGFETSGLYDRVDGDHDAVIDDEELADWFFDVFDLDDDEQLDSTEWDSAREHVGGGTY